MVVGGQWSVSSGSLQELPDAQRFGSGPGLGVATALLVRRVAAGRRVIYDGDAAIDGVPGTAAPVGINFKSAIGAVTGLLGLARAHRVTAP